MASSKIKGINIKIGADTTGLDTALSSIESAGKKATSELRTVESSLKKNNDSVVLWQQKQELLTTAIEKSREKLNLLESAQEQIKRQFDNGEIDGGQYRAFQRELENTRTETSRLETQLEQASQRVEELGDGLEHSGEQAENSANGGYSVLGNVFANIITEGIKLAGTALKNFTQDVITTGMEYESAISNVVAISGAMAEEVELLQSKAEEMGATTKFTAAESAEAMGYMAMAGWKTEDMISGLDGIMDLSAASGEDLASVSDIVTDALTAFGLQASDSAHFADILAAASSNANTNVVMMGETFKYAAPVAGALGFSVEDTAEAIGLMANSGIKASQAGTSLRTILTAMSGSIMLTGDKLGQFTVLTSNADGSMRELSDILADLRTGWKQLTESEQAANAEEIAGKNAMSGFLALMNSAPADVEKLSSAIENADGTAKAMSETMLDNLQGDRTLFESAFDGVKIAVSKELNPALRDLTQYATLQMPEIQKAVEPIADLAVKTMKNVPKIIDSLKTLKPLISGISASALELFAGIKAARLTQSIQTSLIPAVQSLWGVISAHPVGALISAVGVLTAAVSKGVFSYLDTQLDVKSETELLIEKHNEEIQLLADKRRAIEDLNDAFYENVDGIQNQTDRTHDLWNELDKLADQYGNVQQKDKARAEYILNELNAALGTEYSMTGNQIENYRQLSAEIDNVIARKQAEMMLDSYLANSAEMTEQRNTARKDYENANKDYRDKLKKAEDAEKTFKELTGHDPTEVSLYSADIKKELQNLLQSGEEYEAGLAMYYARIDAMSAEDAKTQAKNRYEATSEYFDKLNDLQEAYSLGQYEKMSEIIFAEKDLTNTTLDESATSAEQRLEIYSENLQKTLSDFELAVKDMRQSSIDELEKTFRETIQSGKSVGISPLEIWETVTNEATGQTLKDDVLKFQENGLDISPIISGLVDSGITPAQAFDDWQEVFRTQLKNGGDMKSMLEWLDKSEYNASIPLVFGNNNKFVNYLKEQLAQGIDISSLLELGAKSGLEESEEFVKIFKSTVSENLAKGWDVGNLLEIGSKIGIDLGTEMGESFGEQMATLKAENIDLITFIQWAEEKGKSVAEVFGENFQAEIEEYLNFSNNPELQKATADETTLTDRLIKTFADGDSLAMLARQARFNGLNIGDVFGSDFMKVIQEQINAGYDVNALIKWAETSGETVSEEYSEIYADIVQKSIDKGYEIGELLKWGEKSGLSTADMFGNKYTPEVQSFIDRGFNIDSLLAWAERAGYTTAQVFGERFREISEQYMEFSEVESIARNTGSLVGGQISSILNNLPFMADGGFLSRGQAVVAEAGPELLEVVNGGVRVTPLSQNSRNTSVSDSGSQRIFYNSYTINATIANDYDVSRLAERLETEKRRIEMGMGKA